MIALEISEQDAGLLSESVLSRQVEQGFFDAPYFCSHKRGRNWAAVVERDLTESGGLRRTWLDRARGQGGWYRVPPKGAFIEIAADYFTSGGRRDRERHYFRVASVTSSEIVLFEVPLSLVPRSR